jgi:pyrroline-5-carboxylate reductase
MKIGFIGGGAMAEALAKGILGSHAAEPGDVFISDHKASRAEALTRRYGLHGMVGAASFLPDVDALFLAVKPQAAEAAMAEAASGVRSGAVIISIVAGLTLARLEEHFPSQPVIRVMPNTPAAVGEGMSAYALGSHAYQDAARLAEKLLSGMGRTACVNEPLLDAVTGLSGSGPAYAFLVIDALADGGVAAGLPRAQAIEMAAQTLLGAARMVLSGTHPDVLRDQVTSPAGTTIAGVRVLEQRGVRGAFLDAVVAATERSRELGK